MTDCIIINYKEAAYKQPLNIKGANFIIVDRRPVGVGSLSEAINRGFEQVTTEHFMVVTNVQCPDDLLINLLASIGQHAIIQPTYDSDHLFLRYRSDASSAEVQVVPFTEFTCCLLRSDVFRELGGLDQAMPYVGFDIDYGIRLTAKGYTAAVDFSQRIEHTYNRHLDMRDPYTKKRALMRARYERETRKYLHHKHGIPLHQQLTRLFV
jgi:hypothetical protein